ncbi:MAG: cell wall hydrolase, partial [Lachnospiraceae bacterium]|nr:cell wall hydrolase [Lachnospiraceae bacterium]
ALEEPEPEEEEAALEEPEEEEEPVEAALAEPAAEEAEPAEEAVEEPVQEAETAEEPAGNSFGLEEQEYQVLLKIVEAEAGGEDTVGRMLVANVIMNRVRSGRFPNTITEVVYQRCSGRAQFSPVSDGRIDQVSVSPETVEAVSRAINGEDASAGALYFRSVYSSSGWFDRALRRVVEHGNHIFYTM